MFLSGLCINACSFVPVQLYVYTYVGFLLGAAVCHFNLRFMGNKGTLEKMGSFLPFPVASFFGVLVTLKWVFNEPCKKGKLRELIKYLVLPLCC